MSNQEKFELIEKTIKEVQKKYSIDRLIQDCADKLAITTAEAESILNEFNSNLINEYQAKE